MKSYFDFKAIKRFQSEFYRVNSTFISFQEIFYSRKNFQRPDLQKPPHKNFSEEVKILEKYFGAGAGIVIKF